MHNTLHISTNGWGAVAVCVCGAPSWSWGSNVVARKTGTAPGHLSGEVPDHKGTVVKKKQGNLPAVHKNLQGHDEACGGSPATFGAFCGPPSPLPSFWVALR